MLVVQLSARMLQKSVHHEMLNDQPPNQVPAEINALY